MPDSRNRISGPHGAVAPAALRDNGEALTGVAGIFAELIGRLDAKAPEGRGFNLAFWDGSELPALTPTGRDTPTLRFGSPDALVRIVRSPGELGLSRAWVAGELTVDGDLEAALDLTERWRHAPIDRADALVALKAAGRAGVLLRRNPPPPASEARLRGRRHSTGRDREAITHHYDVSNDFYRRMLGPTMVYSCAYFGSPDESLDDAQTRKLDLICRKLELEPGQRLLDIGCGWGSLLIHAATRFGARAIGVTISDAQAQLARERIRDAGVADLCEVRIQDYREIPDGPYDAISSIGMFEHVGRENLGLYFRQVKALLAPHGLLLNHGIVRTVAAPYDPDTFSTRYVFPDGELHTQGFVIDTMEAAGFELLDDESLRPHYARTLRCWAENHDAHREQAIDEIGPERERVWRLHNHGAALGFERGRLSVHQVIARPLGENTAQPLRVRSFPASAN